MKEQQNVAKIQEIYQAFGRGDIEFIVAQLVDNVHWMAHMDAVVPWGGDFSGKDRVPAFFNAIFESVETEAFEPQEFIAQGDTVVSLGEFACKVKKTGKRSRTRWAFIWKFQGDKICSYEQFHAPGLTAAFR